MNKQSTIHLKNLNGIQYLQNRDDGLPILMLHGNSLGKEIFKDQINSPLFENYRMIAIDLPGHGDSQIDNENLTLKYCMELIIEFVNTLKINHAILVGHSLGGHLAIQITKQIKSIQGLFLYGTPPLSSFQKSIEPFAHNRINELIFKTGRSTEEIKELAKSMNPSKKRFEEIILMIKKSDDRIRTDIIELLQTGSFEDECQIVKDFQKTKTFIFGTNDQVINHDYIKWLSINKSWGKTIRLVANLDHCIMLEKPEEFNTMLIEFIQRAQLNVKT